VRLVGLDGFRLERREELPQQQRVAGRGRVAREAERVVGARPEPRADDLGDRGRAERGGTDCTRSGWSAAKV
jgi:hypothetical protein